MALVWRGLEGSNPLAFLAAVGAMRICQLTWPQLDLRMRWLQSSGWNPEIIGLPVEEEFELCNALEQSPHWAPLKKFGTLGKNINVPLSVFAETVRSVVVQTGSDDRRAGDFIAAFGTDVFDDPDKNRIKYSDLCFITGSGHQHFLGTAKSLSESVSAKHLHEALFGPWKYADEGLSFRWDPDDAKEYALRWRNPSIGGVTSVWGASRLAFEGLPLFPTVASEQGARTVGFATRARNHELTWPIWSHPISVDTIRSLLNIRELTEAVPDRTALTQRGVLEVFRVQRVRIGQGANFKVSFRPASAV
jgi:hypothetical protein